jgi:hypothetical protein
MCTRIAGRSGCFVLAVGSPPAFRRCSGRQVSPEWIAAGCAIAGLGGTIGLAIDRWVHAQRTADAELLAQLKADSVKHTNIDDQLARDIRGLDRDLGALRERMDKAHERYGTRDSHVINQLTLIEIKVAKLEAKQGS